MNNFDPNLFSIQKLYFFHVNLLNRVITQQGPFLTSPTILFIPAQLLNLSKSNATSFFHLLAFAKKKRQCAAKVWYTLPPLFSPWTMWQGAYQAIKKKTGGWLGPCTVPEMVPYGQGESLGGHLFSRGKADKGSTRRNAQQWVIRGAGERWGRNRGAL